MWWHTHIYLMKRTLSTFKESDFLVADSEIQYPMPAYYYDHKKPMQSEDDQ